MKNPAFPLLTGLLLAGCAAPADPNAIHGQAAVSARTGARAAAPNRPAYRVQVRDEQDFTRAEQQGVYFRAIEGAVGVDTTSGHSVPLGTHEPLHVISTDPDTGTLLALRSRYKLLIYISRMFVEASEPTYVVTQN